MRPGLQLWMWPHCCAPSSAGLPRPRRPGCCLLSQDPSLQLLSAGGFVQAPAMQSSHSVGGAHQWLLCAQAFFGCRNDLPPVSCPDSLLHGGSGPLLHGLAQRQLAARLHLAETFCRAKAGKCGFSYHAFAKTGGLLSPSWQFSLGAPAHVVRAGYGGRGSALSHVATSLSRKNRYSHKGPSLSVSRAQKNVLWCSNTGLNCVQGIGGTKSGRSGETIWGQS